MSWRQLVPEFVTQKWDQWFKKVEGALVYFTPAYVSKKNQFFSPIIAVISLITVFYLIGIALGAFLMLFTSLLVLYFILTKVFGIQLEAGDVFVV